MSFFNAFNYSALASRGDSFESREHHDLVDSEKAEAQLPRTQSKVYVSRLISIFPWALAFLSTGFLVYNDFRGPDEFACTRLLNPYSPAIEDGVVEYHDTDFENMFAHKTKYRGPPTPELEAAWDQIWNFGGVEVPLDGPARLGKPSENLAHVNNDKNRGYKGMFEVFHQLHCLNLIRQYTWKDYYGEHLREWLAEGDNHRMVDLNVSTHYSVGDRMHVDHCIETLRLQLMCNADVTPMLAYEDRTAASGSKADFNVHHKCRNWDKVVEWQRANTPDMNTGGPDMSGHGSHHHE